MFPSEAREFIAQPRNQKSKKSWKYYIKKQIKKITESGKQMILLRRLKSSGNSTPQSPGFSSKNQASRLRCQKLVELEEMGLIVNAVVKKMKYLIEVDMTELEEVILNKQDIDFTELESIINKLSLNNLKSAALEMKELFKKYQPQEHKEYSKKWLSIRSELGNICTPLPLRRYSLVMKRSGTITDIKIR